MHMLPFMFLYFENAEFRDDIDAIMRVGARILIISMPAICWFLMTYLYHGLPYGELSWLVWLIWGSIIPCSLAIFIQTVCSAIYSIVKGFQSND